MDDDYIKSILNDQLREHLLRAARDLEEGSSALTTQVKQVGEYLRGLRLGVEAWVQMGGTVTGKRASVGYARLNKRWGILIAEWEAGDTEPTYWHFMDAARHLRVQAVEYIPELFPALTRAAQELTEKTRKAIATATHILKGIEDAKLEIAKSKDDGNGQGGSGPDHIGPA